ncbi:hypothetical protein MA5S0422_1250 [Mycobacteroides abscessus 5S-0422]|uniref:Uncharacterized protein n=2 Tax=Mycobacteroides abscessus TaxID=36809 RepID=X8DV79_9MYCO|nr:hypothetical protein [Mycobacteroides abscessus]EIU17480.1 hypothetical protein MA5S0421_0520 [Mycobacteroides abscessus 5S-0421]EIU17669.1 hypothetical protein MA5S0304_0261 [Mycobacteroides abscessus 5S-0304]EIU18619.1 hypothetical protein MA5S0422_1250 [Mycobacteroides abscessus 5S-0422]EIU20305.1 hypothetical protein MA5S0708_2328 [Mycobacteroides abscessus 5S-0708]EIU34818.1 hypothetical protein MA5S0817_0295 [Mycobacteroides abscessus 5S-0817]EIU35194.1 hypothetical protein MA5S1212_
MIDEHASKVVPFTGLLSVFVVVDGLLVGSEVELDEVEVDPGVGVPWIPSCVHPATNAIATAARGIHFMG